MSKTVSFRAKENIYKLLQATAQKKGTRPSEFVRRMLVNGLRKEYGVEPPKSEEQIGIPTDLGEETEITDEELGKKIDEIIKKKLMEKQIPPTAPKVEKAEIELSDEEIERELELLEGKEEEETYVCGNCSYQQKGEFNPCPKCGKKLTW